MAKRKTSSFDLKVWWPDGSVMAANQDPKFPLSEQEWKDATLKYLSMIMRNVQRYMPKEHGQ